MSLDRRNRTAGIRNADGDHVVVVRIDAERDRRTEFGILTCVVEELTEASRSNSGSAVVSAESQLFNNEIPRPVLNFE